MLSLSSGLLLSLAMAQEPVEAFADPAPSLLDPTQEELVQVNEQLEALKAELRVQAAQDAEHERLTALLQQASDLMDDRLSLAERLAAARSLGAQGDERALVFLRSVALSWAAVELRVASVQALASWPGDEVRAVALELVEATEAPSRLRISAIEVLEGMPVPALGSRLYAIASDRRESEEMREACVQALNRTWPEQLDDGLEPVHAGLSWTAAPGILANGVVGGVLLGSVGTLGRSGAGSTIGGVGGSAIGLGTGVTYAVTRPLTFGQSLQYTAGVAAGVNAGVLSGTLLNTGERGTAALLMVATGAGAGAGAWRMQKDPQPGDVIEGTVASLLGQHFFAGATDMAIDLGGRGSHSQVRAGSQLLGAGLGMGAGALLNDSWELEIEDGIFAGVAGAEAAWVGTWAPSLVGVDHVAGIGRTSWLTGTALALASAEFFPVSPKRSAFTAYGAVAGNMVGAGLPMMAGSDDRQTTAWVMLPLGVTGASAGYLLAERMTFSAGDLTMVGVGTGLLAAETGAISQALEYMSPIFNSSHEAGLLLTGTGVGSAGLVALSQVVDPEPSQVLVAASGAAWGTWYGTLTPVALGAQLRPEGRLLIGTLSADALLVGAVITQLPAVNLAPRRTLIPQLSAVTGATLGALATALSTSEGQGIAAGAVAGSVVGFVGGGLAEVRLGARRAERDKVQAWLRPQRDWSLPENIGFSAGPTVLEDGRQGVNLGVNGIW